MNGGKTLALLMLSFTLAACGGGSSSGDDPATPNPPTPPSPPTPPTPPTPDCSALIQEAESGVLTGGFESGLDSAASNGSFIHAPSLTGEQAAHTGNTADYCFDIVSSGQYTLVANVAAASSNADSFYISVDGGTAFPWDAGVSSSFDERTVVQNGAPLILDFIEGEHNVRVHVLDGAAQLDTIGFKAYTPPPNNPPVAVTDVATLARSTAVVIDVLANDDDSDGSLDASSVQIVTQPAYGMLSVNSVNGRVTYTHDGSPYTGDSFSYRVADNDGDLSNTATVTLSVDTGACGGLVQQAELATLYGNFDVVTDAAAQNNAYVLVPDGTGNPPAADPAQRVDFCVNIPSAGNYNIAAIVRGPSGTSDSFYVGVDGATPELWGFATSNNFVERVVGDGSGDRVYALSAGQHTVSFFQREDGAGLDQIEIKTASIDVDSDGDGEPDATDAFPNDPSEQHDTDADGVGDNADVFPNDPSEQHDSDNDGVGDNADPSPTVLAPGKFPAQYSRLFVAGDSISVNRSNPNWGEYWAFQLKNALGIPISNAARGGWTSDDLLNGRAGIFQLTNLYGNPRVVDPNGLHVVYVGHNDVFNPTDVLSLDIPTAIENIRAILNEIKDGGGRYVMVPNIYDMTTQLSVDIAPHKPAVSLREADFNARLATMLNEERTADFRILAFDVRSVIGAVWADPAAYGISNVVDACGSTQAACANHFWWDAAHPTDTVHAAIKDAAEQLLNDAQ